MRLVGADLFGWNFWGRKTQEDLFPTGLVPSLRFDDGFSKTLNSKPGVFPGV